LFLLVNTLLFTICSTRFTADVPLAIFSGEGYLVGGQNVAVTNTVLLDDAENFLNMFVNPFDTTTTHGTLSQYVSPKSTPEVVVIFAEAKVRSDHLSTHKGAFTNLRNLMKTEKSSLYAPFVDLSYSFDSSIANVAYSASLQSGKVYYVGKGSTLLHDIKKRVPSTTPVTNYDLEGVLTKAGVFSNGATDLIIVHLDNKNINLDIKYKESDTIIEKVHRLISASTTKYVCTYIGLEYDEPLFTTKFADPQNEKRFIFNTEQLTGNGTNSSNASIPIFRQYFGGWFWELFLVSILLIPLMIMGVYAIDGIQTPLFADPKDKDKLKKKL